MAGAAKAAVIALKFGDVQVGDVMGPKFGDEGA
jgi:hypothetical protein